MTQQNSEASFGLQEGDFVDAKAVNQATMANIDAKVENPQHSKTLELPYITQADNRYYQFRFHFSTSVEAVIERFGETAVIRALNAQHRVRFAAIVREGVKAGLPDELIQARIDRFPASPNTAAEAEEMRERLVETEAELALAKARQALVQALTKNQQFERIPSVFSMGLSAIEKELRNFSDD